MKHLLVLLGVTTCLVAPLSAQDTPGNDRGHAVVVQSKAKAVTKTAATRPNARCIYYITSVNATGSHIPLVIRRYKGEDTALFQSSHGAGYNVADIGLTGSLNVGGALLALDPAISSGGAGARR